MEKRKGVLSATEQRYEEAKARMTAEGRQLGSLQQRIQVRVACQLNFELKQTHPTSACMPVLCSYLAAGDECLRSKGWSVLVF